MMTHQLIDKLLMLVEEGLERCDRWERKPKNKGVKACLRKDLEIVREELEDLEAEHCVYGRTYEGAIGGHRSLIEDLP